MTKRKVVFEHDADPDYSWLEQDHYNPAHPSYDPVYRSKAKMEAGEQPLDGNWYRNPENHVALSMIVCELTDNAYDWEEIDSLSSIDFLADESNWQTGTWCYVDDIPEQCDYQRDLARDAGLPE